MATISECRVSVVVHHDQSFLILNGYVRSLEVILDHRILARKCGHAIPESIIINRRSAEHFLFLGSNGRDTCGGGQIRPPGFPQTMGAWFKGACAVAVLFVAAGKTDKVQQLLDQFGIDDSAVGSAGFEKLVAEEGQVWLKAVSSLGLTAE